MEMRIVLAMLVKHLDLVVSPNFEMELTYNGMSRVRWCSVRTSDGSLASRVASLLNECAACHNAGAGRSPRVRLLLSSHFAAAEERAPGAHPASLGLGGRRRPVPACTPTVFFDFFLL